jgi:hypothetical protein
MKMKPDQTLVMAVVLAAYAPTVAAEDQCADVLRSGVWDVASGSGSTQTSSAFLNWFCSKENASKSKLDSLSVKASVPLPDLPMPVGLGGSFSSERGESYAREACRVDQGSFAHASQFTQFVQRASEVVVGAWEHCMTTSGQVIVATTTTFQDPRAFSMKTKI